MGALLQLCILYPLMEVAILDNSHLILLIAKSHQIRNCFTLHFVFTFVCYKGSNSCQD